jgi:hypothetical protein
MQSLENGVHITQTSPIEMSEGIARCYGVKDG